MPKFPNTVQFNALNRPVRLEVAIRNLDVEGTIPAEIEGAFFRAVPDPAHPPLFDDDIALSGDGMVSRFLIENGHVDYDIRYVHTARYVAERKARKALFGRYRNPFTDRAGSEGSGSHRFQHDAGVARRTIADDEGRWPRVRGELRTRSRPSVRTTSMAS